MMVTVPENNVEPDTSQVQPNKRRRKKSIVWEHFTVEAVSDDCTRACCKQCKQTFAYSTGTKLSGTSHLKRHIATGTCLGSRRKERNQLRSSDSNGNGSVANPPRRKYNGGSWRVNFQFDQELSRHELAKMIIMHEYSVDIVNHSAFVSFIKRLQPKFQMVDFNTIQEDCVAIYQKEKQELFEMLNGTPGRVSLSLDLLTSSETLGYVFLTGHFINSSWKLHSRILNVVMVPFPYNKDVLSHAVGRCLAEWGLENKLFSLTLSRSLFRNDTGSLRSYLSDRNLLKANGQLLIEHCFTQVLSSMVQDALGGMQDIIDKVRKSIQYVKKSQAHEERFLELKQKLQVPSTKNLSLDDQTKWNSTYFMLLAALELKEVFSCLDTADPGYQLILSMDDWNQIDILCNYLKLLYDGADAIIRAVNPTSEIFFHEAWKIQLELLCWVQSPDPLILNFLNPLREKFDTYWKECRLVLAMAVVFDPQYKMKILEDRFSKIYGDEASMYLKEVDETIHLLFSEYTPQFLLEHVSMVEIKTEEPSFDDAGDCGSLPPADDFFDSDVFMSELSSSMHAKSELDQYLEEGLVSVEMEFNVLNWWDDNNFKYPCLSKMARDILSIPMCAVGIESVFGNGCREMKHTWSCLQPETVQALVCAKDWLKYGSSETISNALVKVEVPPY